MSAQPVGRKVALITGANKGLGLEIARQLGRPGRDNDFWAMAPRRLFEGHYAARTEKGTHR
jgi:NAD(P)-dependent dehydrogenase (short-subunit alcohol dehydrogenase family)